MVTHLETHPVLGRASQLRVYPLMHPTKLLLNGSKWGMPKHPPILDYQVPHKELPTTYTLNQVYISSNYCHNMVCSTNLANKLGKLL